MRHILMILLVCAAGIGAAWWIAHLPGAVSLQLGATTVEAKLPVAVLAFIVLILAVYVLTRLLATLLHLPGAFRRGGERAQRARGDQAVTDTLIALAARDPADARREAARALRLLGETPQTLLLTAYAGSIAGNESEAQTAFEKLAERKDAKFLGLRGLLRLAIQNEDFARAAVLARQAEEAHPGAAWIRTERTQLALRTSDWGEALKLTHDDAHKAGFAAAAAIAHEDPAAAIKLARQAFKRDPSLPHAGLAYATRLRDAGREKAAQGVLRQAWAASPNPEISAFALAIGADAPARLKLANDLVRDAPQTAESYFLLARLSLEDGLTGEAHRLVQLAQQRGLNQKRVQLLLADIAQAEGDEAAQRDALRAAASAPPDPVWRCESCGHVLPAWQPACENCHVPARVIWTTPSTNAVITRPK